MKFKPTLKTFFLFLNSIYILLTFFLKLLATIALTSVGCVLYIVYYISAKSISGITKLLEMVK